MSEIKVTVIEQPGKLGSMKASALCTFFLRFYEEHEAIREQTEKIIMKWEAEKNVQREALHA